MRGRKGGRVRAAGLEGYWEWGTVVANEGGCIERRCEVESRFIPAKGRDGRARLQDKDPGRRSRA